MWADRISRCASPRDKVLLHENRWDAWNTFIESFAKGSIKKETLPITIDHNQEEDEKQFQKLLIASKKRWSKIEAGDVVFDASFGSANSTSDLDITVLSKDTRVLNAWVEYLQIWQKNNPGKTFTNYYDSNFYFEPCDDSMQSLKLGLVDIDFTTQDSYFEEFTAVKEYTDAYQHEGKVRGIYPNPRKMTPDDEIAYYKKSGRLAQKFAEAVASNQLKNIRKTYLDFALCKIEGIISIPALAICGVFGPEVMQKFIQKKDIHPKALQIGIYEMLCNLRMHSHNSGELHFKSKYAIRLVNLLRNNKFICPADKVPPLSKTNEASMEDIKPAMIFLLDYLDEDGCEMDKYKTLNFDIDKIIQTMRDKILDVKIGNLTKRVSVDKLQLRF